MITLASYIKKVLTLCLLSVLILFSGFFELYAEEIDWIEVAKTSNGIQFIDSNSIKYNDKGLLSVITKYSEINSDDQQIINSTSYLMAIDCGNRLYSKLPIGSELKQVKAWKESTDNKIIKKTIVNTCLY